MDVQDILTDQEVRQIRVADRDQDALMQADPSRGELFTAEHHFDGDD